MGPGRWLDVTPAALGERARGAVTRMRYAHPNAAFSLARGTVTRTWHPLTAPHSHPVPAPKRGTLTRVAPLPSPLPPDERQSAATVGETNWSAASSARRARNLLSAAPPAAWRRCPFSENRRAG